MISFSTLDEACELADSLREELQNMRHLLDKCRDDFLGSYYIRSRQVGNLIDRAVTVAGDLATSLEVTHAIRCGSTLGGDVALARQLVNELDGASHVVRTLARDLSRERTDRRDRDIRADAIASARRLANGLSGTRNVALAVAQAVARSRGRPRDLDVVHELDRLLALFVARDRDPVSQPDAGYEVIRQGVDRSALRLTGVATQLLPSRDRTRYTEEWRSELLSLGLLNAPRRQQVRFGLGVLSRSLGLRLALLSLPHMNRKPER